MACLTQSCRAKIAAVVRLPYSIFAPCIVSALAGTNINCPQIDGVGKCCKSIVRPTVAAAKTQTRIDTVIRWVVPGHRD